MWRRVIAQTRKELTQLVRDRLALALALLLPNILLLMLSFALSLSVSRLPVVVQDFDSTAASRSYIDAFRASVTLRVVPWSTDRPAEEALRSGAARAVLIVPEHLGRDLARHQPATVQLLVDASDANTAKLINTDAGQITTQYAEENQGGSSTAPVSAQIRLWFNPGLDSPKFYAPGIFVLGLSMFPPLLASIAMAKESEQKTILQVYVSNISAHEFLLGKTAAFMAVAICELALLLVTLLTVFGMHFAGDPTPMLVASVLYAFCVAAFGTFIGAAIPSQAAAIQAISVGGFLLVFLLSGLIYQVSSIPAGLRWISNLVWGRYYIDVLRDALLQGGGWAAMWLNVAAIGIIGGVFYLLAWLVMRRMQVNA